MRAVWRTLVDGLYDLPGLINGVFPLHGALSLREKPFHAFENVPSVAHAERPHHFRSISDPSGFFFLISPSMASTRNCP